MEKRSRLGRGLQSLMGSALDEIVTESPTVGVVPPAAVKDTALPPSPDTEQGAASADEIQVFHVELSRIIANPNQPRRSFDQSSLDALAESIKTAGVIQPIVCRVVDGQYEVIAGERRWRAAKLAQLAEIPVIVRRVSPAERSQIALIENIHREDLNPLERAIAYQSLLKESSCTHQELAEKLGEDRSSIANHLRLLELPDNVRQMVGTGLLTFGHAKLLAGVEDADHLQTLAETTVKEHLSVRALEKLLKDGVVHRPAAAAKPTIPHIADLERRISRDLQMRAEVKQGIKGKKGKLVLHYASLDQFDELLHRLGIKVDD